MLCLPPLRSYGRYVGQSLHGLGREVRSDRLLQGLMLFFTLLYLPQAFIIIEDMGLITGFEVDPGSHMQAIIALLGRYNMHEGYHSRYYGWTFFALNFFLLQPVVLAKLVFGLGNTVYYLAVRLILFGVGAVFAGAVLPRATAAFRARLDGGGGGPALLHRAVLLFVLLFHPPGNDRDAFHPGRVAVPAEFPPGAGGYAGVLPGHRLAGLGDA